MELVIKIPVGLKDVFESRTVTALDVEEMRMAIKNGTPLPKGHGRIIDESKITKCYMPVNKFDVRGIKTNAPTIIEGSESE